MKIPYSVKSFRIVKRWENVALTISAKGLSLWVSTHGHGGLFSKSAYAYIISWNGSEALNLCLGQPLKGLFVVALAFTACYGPHICGIGGVRLAQ
jgi:hypothetical protein